MNRVFVCLNKLNTGHKKIENTKSSSLNTYTCMCVRAQRTHKQDLRSTRQPGRRHARGPLRKARQPGRGQGRSERPHAHRRPAPSTAGCRPEKPCGRVTSASPSGNQGSKERLPAPSHRASSPDSVRCLMSVGTVCHSAPTHSRPHRTGVSILVP